MNGRKRSEQLMKLAGNFRGRGYWVQNGSTLYLKNFYMKHRYLGPAVIDKYGDQEWYHNNERHRLDGPAMIGNDGFRRWYHNTQFHRLDGPAEIYPNGLVYWFAHNMTEDERWPHDSLDKPNSFN